MGDSSLLTLQEPVRARRIPICETRATADHPGAHLPPFLCRLDPAEMPAMKTAFPKRSTQTAATLPLILGPRTSYSTLQETVTIICICAIHASARLPVVHRAQSSSIQMVRRGSVPARLTPASYRAFRRMAD